MLEIKNFCVHFFENLSISIQYVATQPVGMLKSMLLLVFVCVCVRVCAHK